MKDFFKKIIESAKAHKKRTTIIISVTAVALVCIIVALSLLSALLFNRLSQGIVPNSTDLANAYPYERVLIIGVDGTGDYFKNSETPNFNKMFGGFYTDTAGKYSTVEVTGGKRVNSSVTFTGKAVYPSVSAENWSSMFHGVRPVYHNIIWAGSNQKLESGVKPNSKYPSFVKNYLDQNPTEKVLSVCSWCGVNNGAIEDLDNVKKINSTKELLYDIVSGADTSITNASFLDYLREKTSTDGFMDATIELRDAITCEKIIEETALEDYKIAYMHFDQVDHGGHMSGYGKMEYEEAVSRVDTLIGRLFDAYNERGWLDSTLFILCADHGHRKSGGHCYNSTTEVNVTFAVSGVSVKQGTPGRYVNTDLAAIVTYGLRAKASSTWQSRVPYNMFTTLDNYKKK